MGSIALRLATLTFHLTLSNDSIFLLHRPPYLDIHPTTIVFICYTLLLPFYFSVDKIILLAYSQL